VTAGPLNALDSLPSRQLAHYPTPVDELRGFAAALGTSATLLVKRDDAIPFAFGGNKVRKIELLAAHALAEGADTLITVGGIQSNHARVTAAAAAKLGLRCVLVVNGTAPSRLTANALIDALVGAEVQYVASRDERAPTMRRIADRLRAAGRRPYEIPVGASTPLGAIGFVRAVGEVSRQIAPPDVIIHSTSSGGTQSGLIAGCALFGLPTRVIGISADDPRDVIRTNVREILSGLESMLGVAAGTFTGRSIDVDDRFVGDGYGIPTDASREAIALAARTEALFLDPTYTAKAMAALIAYVRRGDLRDARTILFWHTGGQVALFQ
jgi:1-aminocyclopropane-1-carboxylate deaminase/D-cysteine desulfhydrase-like pyridoxal-dependent ACC family enzyme